MRAGVRAQPSGPKESFDIESTADRVSFTPRTLPRQARHRLESPAWRPAPGPFSDRQV